MRGGKVVILVVMRKRLVMVVCSCVVLAGVLGGCQRALFPRNAPRTQFETYDRLRNDWVPTQEMDVYGNPQPALRARLSQRRGT